MLNHIVLMGRLTKDPEKRMTQGGTSVTRFTIAVDRDFEKDKVDFIDCTAWRNTADFVAKYFAKGRMIVVSGRLTIQEWTDKNNNRRKNPEIVADAVYFGDSKAKDAAVKATDFSEMEDDDPGLPF